MKVALYGGSFNPMHNGHIFLAQELLRQGWVDEVWFEVSPQNPLKQRTDLADDAARLEMAQRAVAGIPHTRIDDTEMHLPRPSYMLHTLRALQQKHPSVNFCLLIGADNWDCFPRWYRFEEILRDFPIFVYPREGSVIDASTLPSTVTLLEVPLFPISSTEIRGKIHNGEDITGLVPQAVQEYMESTLIYK
jgi:nicotinate-nucleotide adenylyltransferase